MIGKREISLLFLFPSTLLPHCLLVPNLLPSSFPASLLPPSAPSSPSTVFSARLSAFFFPSPDLVPCLILFSPTDLFPLSVSLPNVVFAPFHSPPSSSPQLLLFPSASPLSHRLLPHLLPFPSPFHPDPPPFPPLPSPKSSSHLFLPSPSSSPSSPLFSSPLLLPHRALPASSSALSPQSSSRIFFSPVHFSLPHRFLPLSLSASSQHRFLWRRLFLPSPSRPPQGLPHPPLHLLASLLHLPAYSRSSVFPPLPLLPSRSPSSRSSPGLLPPTVFFLIPHRFLPISSHFLAAVSVCRSLFPSSSPLRIVFFPSLLFSTIFFPSPPFSSRFHLPTFSQQRLPAALFFPRNLFSPLPLPTVFAPDRLLAHSLLRALPLPFT
ncbi:uncharacterized protein LOC100936714 [Pongo abelii]|uniref:uncharacterized protein LOC100936714 n=1 Tax=Pongo abelii TaxID=9601 RepID=UPI0023E8178C|nr:uncharacterized protein LOC100936714 [Pongo abelii]